MKLFRPRLFPVATTLFFLSGMVGLGYELIWIRKAALVVGSSQIALSTVLTAFFLGIAIGSWLVGNYLRSKRWSPLFVYGLFEVAIGLFALAFPWLFRGVEAIYGAAYPALSQWGAGLFALRFILLFLLFLVPTVFMGGTLPLLLDGLVEKDATIGARTSFLYGVNILGAVVGVLLTSYWAIPTFGLNGSSFLGADCNIAIGCLALLAFRGVKPVHATPERPRLGLFFPMAAFASGLLAIAYQICWIRYFNLFNTGTVYLTAILLAVYLLALAAGSFVLAPLLARQWRPLGILGAVQALVPLTVLYGLEAWRLAEYRFALRGMKLADGRIVPQETLEIDSGYRYFWSFFSETADATFFAPLFQVALSVFLPVVLIGAGLPALIAAATRRSSALRSASGRLLFWNTLGSSAGGFIGGYALLPLLGLHWTLVLLGLGSLGLSVAAYLQDARPTGSGVDRLRWALPALGLVGALLFAFGREDITTFTIRYHGYGRDMGFSRDSEAGRNPTGSSTLEVVEGPLTTSFLFDEPNSTRLGSGNVCLAVAYKQGLSSQAIQGHLPCLFYPGDGLPKDCLGICLGSGQSFGALLLYPIQTLDVVDISSEIIELSLRHYGPYNHDLGTDPRVTFFLDDGRHFVERAGDASYDVISMEPPPPTAEGVSSLYSVEFYQEIARVLRGGGVFMQWLPLYRVSPLDARGIVKAQASVFPETFVVKAFQDDFMIVSYASRPRFPIEAIRERVKVFEKERLVKSFAWNERCKHPIASLEGVLSFIVMGPQDIAEMEAPVLYRDDNQILSYTSGDREILRRYEGPALSPLSFAALRLSPYAELKQYFDPPLDESLVVVVERERAASLAEPFGVPDPTMVSSRRMVLERASDATERAAVAIELAVLHDGMLAKREAFELLEIALDACDSGAVKLADSQLAAAQRIVRHAIAPYANETRVWVERVTGQHAASALQRAITREWTAFKDREAERVAAYLWGE